MRDRRGVSVRRAPRAAANVGSTIGGLTTAAPIVRESCTIMNPDKRTSYVTRDSILKLLSDDEIARVSTAETAANLMNGDEYLDLEKLEHGVHHARGAPSPMGRVLPRKSVHPQTWSKILTHLEGART